MIEKPLITVSGRKTLLKSDLHQRIITDLPQEGIEWRRRLDSNAKLVYIDVEFVDFDSNEDIITSNESNKNNGDQQDSIKVEEGDIKTSSTATTATTLQTTTTTSIRSSDNDNDESQGFFIKKLLGQPIIHTFWADKSDFDGENRKIQFEQWIGKVQASNCTEWAIIIVEDGDFKAQLSSVLFKSKLQSSASQTNISSAVNSATGSETQNSFMDRVKKGLSTIFQTDSNSDRWLTLMNQDKFSDKSKVQESYLQFMRKFRNIIMASFSKKIELFEEQLRVQRELRNKTNWDFYTYFSMQEELASAYEFLTLFDEALVQYGLLDALCNDYIKSSAKDLLPCLTEFDHWYGLCLDMNNKCSIELRRSLTERRASLLDFRNYLFAKQCDLMLLQNQPWRVAASTVAFIENCISEHETLNINTIPGALSCWSVVSALEVLQKCECYSCTSTMENYSFYTVDIWNLARRKLLEVGKLTHQLPGMSFDSDDNSKKIAMLIEGLGPDPHNSVSIYQKGEMSPFARIVDALAGQNRFSKHLIEISELTLGTYKHIGRKRHALLIGRELADFYMAYQNFSKALPFLMDMERSLKYDKWDSLLDDIRKCITDCQRHIKVATSDSAFPAESS